MQNLSISLLESSLAMSAIALVYMAITPLLSKKFTAKGLYYAWLVIVVGLIIPFRFHPQASAININTLIPGLKTASGSFGEQAVSAATVTSPVIPWSVLAGSLWLVGAIVFIAYHAVRHRRFLRMVKRWSDEITAPQVLSTLQDVRTKLGIRRQIGLKVCPGISSPMLMGFARPVILLPAVNLPADELELILQHELVHFKRGDIWYKTIVFLATALHWFNPFVYMMAREISVQCEISCDEEVVKNTDRNGRQRYVETIIGLIRKQSRMQTVFSTNFYGGKQGMKNRILSIMDSRSKKWGISIVAVIVIATLSTGIVLKLNTENSDNVTPLTASDAEVGVEKERPDPPLTGSTSPTGLDGEVEGEGSEPDPSVNGSLSGAPKESLEEGRASGDGASVQGPKMFQSTQDNLVAGPSGAAPGPEASMNGASTRLIEGKGEPAPVRDTSADDSASIVEVNPNTVKQDPSSEPGVFNLVKD